MLCLLSVAKKSVAKKSVAKKRSVKKTVAKKSVTKKKSNVSAPVIAAALTKEHTMANNAAERLSAAFEKAEAAVSTVTEKGKAAADKAKQTKRPAQINAAAKAKERVIASKLKHKEAQLKLKSQQAIVKGHELLAAEMVKMNELKDKAVAFFADRWEKDYLKKLVIKQKSQAKRKVAAAIARRKAALAKKRAAKSNK